MNDEEQTLENAYLRWQFDQFSPFVGQRVAEIGCGSGHYLPFLKDTKRYLGLESRSQRREDLLKLKWPENAKLAKNPDILTHGAVRELKNHRIQTIICVNHLASMEEDWLAMKNMIRALPPEGHLCLIVPAMPCLDGPLDQAEGFLRRYSRRSLCHIIHEDEPIEIVRCHYFDLMGAVERFCDVRVFRRRSKPSDLNHRKVNKIVSMIERVSRPPFGLSIVLVLKKVK
ncbi:MAG: hypothetical protein JW893_01100 [Candidatus Omnitrophica bacterium]|nr:hypothetical protein [Candidatus Omnitrophota bacterium]